jgi:hypothetical protein
MAQNGLPVAGAAHVKFKAVSPMLQRKVESGDGVFRRIKASTAMSEK